MSSDTKTNPMDAGTVILSAIVISSIGALFYNLLPMYLGTAQDSRNLDNSALGFISTAFFFGYNLVTISAFYWIRKWSWRLIALVSTPLAGIGLFASTQTESYLGLLVTTAVAGGAFAAIYGVGTTILSDTSNPARWFGLKIAAEAATGAILLLILPGTLIADYGFDGMVIGMLISMLLLSPLLFWLPAKGIKTREEELDKLVTEKSTVETINHAAIWSAIFSALIFFSGSSAVWAFMERLGINAGFEPASIAVLLALTLGFATMGSLMAAGLGKRFGNVSPFLFNTVAIIAAMILLGYSASFSTYAIACCIFTAAFGAGLPFAVAEIADLDVDGRYAILSVPAIGFGAMIGPGMAGLLYVGGSPVNILVLVALAMIIAGALMWNARRCRC